MYLINDKDYEYIANKYHDTKKPFDNFKRFIRNDEYFDKNSGMDGEDIKAGIFENDKIYSNLSHPVRKAQAFKYVLENTRISCDARDIFPAINAIDRPLNATLIGLWRKEVFTEVIPETEKRRIQYYVDGLATLWPDYDHSVPVWNRILTLGFSGILQESEQKRKEVAQTQKQNDFFEGIRITYQALIDFVGRLAQRAKKDGNEKMYDALCVLQNNPPKTFYQALLLSYIYFITCEHIEGLQVRSLSNFDVEFYSFYKSDINNGVDELEIRKDIAYYFMQFTAIGNYWNQPLYLGGSDEDGNNQVNELSYILLDVHDKMCIYNPKIQIKVSEKTPKEFMFKAIDRIRRGNNSIVFVGEQMLIKSLMDEGLSLQDARVCDVKGCYEFAPKGALYTGMNYVNLAKPLEYAINNGCDGITKKQVAPQSPDVSEYKTFDEFYNEYKKQLTFVMDQVIETVNSYEEYLYHINPQSMLSATFPSCLEKGVDALGGGAKVNNTEMEFGSVATVIDSITLIKKYVFDKKQLTFTKLKEILDADFNGYEDFRQQLLADREKYGNDRVMPDSIAVDIVNFIQDYLKDKKNSRGGIWVSYSHVARQSYTWADKTMSTPNGRKRGEELSKNVTPTLGQCRSGVTSAILSATKLKFNAGAPLDLWLHPSTVVGEKGLQNMYDLINTFVKLDGHAVQFNVIDAKTLREAQKEPEKYQDLQIRVCGWNALWVNIDRKEQEKFIEQAESI